MRKKKILAIILVAILSLSCLTGCSDKGKEDMNNKLNNKTTETTKKDDSKADNKTSESTTDNKSDSASKPSEDKKSDSNSGNTGSNSSANEPSNGNSKSDSSTSKPSGNTSSNKPAEEPSKPSQSTEKPAETKPAHQHTWVDHTATKQVPRTVHHDAVYETVNIPAVTKHQIQCLTCGQWFDSFEELAGHQLYDTDGACSGYDTHGERDVVITPAHTEQKLVKEAYDETVYDTQTYVDYQYCSECGQHQ